MRYLPTLLLALSLLSCRAAPPRHLPEYLDPTTAAMVSTVDHPVIFARGHQDVAANARQYVNIVGASVNRQGQYEYLLLAYIWSTVDARLGAGAHPGGTLVLLADERRIRLPRDSRSLEEAGIASAPLRPLHFKGAPRVYQTDAETLQFIARAAHVRLVLEGDQDLRPFDLWTDHRRELGQLASGN